MTKRKKDASGAARARFASYIETLSSSAETEARTLAQSSTGTEMLLLALIAEDREAASLLRALGAEEERTRDEVQKLVPSGTNIEPAGSLPLTERATQVLARARTLREEVPANSADSLVALLAVVEDIGVVRRALQQIGVSVAKLHVVTLMKLGYTKDDAVRMAQERLGEVLKTEVARTQKVLEEHVMKNVPLADQSLQRTQAEFENALKRMSGQDIGGIESTIHETGAEEKQSEEE